MGSVKGQIIALDSETTGLSIAHGTRPFFISIYHESTGVQYWEWPVDPLTRKVKVDPEDVVEIQALLDGADRIVGHNLKFDIRMLAAVGIKVDWAKTEDTIVAYHAIDSAAKHDLTAAVWDCLGINIKPHEDAMREVVLAARRIVQQARLRVSRYGPEEHTQLCDWLIAEDGLTDPDDQSQMMPGDNKEHWRADGWLPHALATSGFGSDYVAEHPTVADRLREYGCCDTMATYKLWVVLRQKLINKGLWDLYRFQMRLPEISARMEDRGIGVIPEQVIGLTKEYREEAERLEKVMLGIAEQYDYPLVVPKGTKSKSLDTFLFDPKYLNLPVVKRTEKGNPSFDADAKEQYQDELPRNKLPHLFVSSIDRRQVLTKAVGTLEGYSRFMIQAPNGHWVMHSSLNQTGTVTLQWSSNNPNQQNVGKQSKANLRRTFGPGSGRVWYSMDAQNIQLRVPAYECDEKDLVEVFDHPERGPYYGSYHLVIFDVVHPDLFAKHGKECKTLFEDTHYQWVKNANFARQFGAQEKKVDATFRVKGAYKKIAKRFPKIDKLNRHYIEMALKRGYVETIPDRDIDPKRGYPLQVPRNEWDGVEPTKPFCYHVAGTAQLWMRKAMVRCEERLVEWRGEGLDAWMVMQVHDELVFDFPARWDGETDLNMPQVYSLRQLMESCGEGISIPTPVSIERHQVNWAKGESL